MADPADVAGELDAARERVKAAEAELTAALKARQQVISRAVAAGMTTRQIGRRLKLTHGRIVQIHGRD